MATFYSYPELRPIMVTLLDLANLGVENGTIKVTTKDGVTYRGTYRGAYLRPDDSKKQCCRLQLESSSSDDEIVIDVASILKVEPGDELPGDRIQYFSRSGKEVSAS